MCPAQPCICVLLKSHWLRLMGEFHLPQPGTLGTPVAVHLRNAAKSIGPLLAPQHRSAEAAELNNDPANGRWCSS
jgi:hypothetical protein